MSDLMLPRDADQPVMPLQAAAKLSPKMRYCLMAFSAGQRLTTFDVARKAEQDGINRTSCRFEWADAPMRALRIAGLLDHAGGTDGLGRRYHALTEQGRMVLNDQSSRDVE